MKLQTQYSRITLMTSILVLIIGSIGYYFLLRHALLKPVDEALKVEEQEIIDYIATHGELPPESQYRDQIIQFIPDAKPVQRRIINNDVFSEQEKEYEASRQIFFSVNVKGKGYTAVVTKSRVEAEDLLLFILSITTGIIILLFAVIFLVNRFLLKRLWSPFYSTLKSISTFQLSNQRLPTPKRHNIEEFDALNEALVRMTDKMQSDYFAVKKFADNASHEMQTPLAVINSKIDLLIQDNNLSEKNAENLYGIYKALNKLRNLNESLLLLTKIENNQFVQVEAVQLDQLILEKLSDVEELTASNTITVTTAIKPASVNTNRFMMEMLLNNLLMNAIKHNVKGGMIYIEASHKGFEVSNTSGISARLDQSQIFNRFQKSSSSDGLGLGLAIAKQVCSALNFELEYQYRGGRHCFLVTFHNENNKKHTQFKQSDKI